MLLFRSAIQPNEVEAGFPLVNVSKEWNAR
jgi:hypothetical protein